MTRLLIRHETRYDYERAVAFGPHRLMLRPRDSHAVRVVEANLTFSQAGATRWVYDALGNCVCWYQPKDAACLLSIASELVIERYPAPLDPLPIADPHTAIPIVYSREDRIILAPFIAPATDDGDLLGWLRDHVGRPDELAVDYLLRLNREIHGQLSYAARDDEGVQTPSETLSRGAGACRDYAWLMVEALRRLGFAARFVTGYLHSPSDGQKRGAGATHAWCEVYLPDLGWMEFDPTNGLAESGDLIPIAATRTPQQAAPVSGTIVGDPGHSTLFVGVDVRAFRPEPAAELVNTTERVPEEAS